jgi:hypothetical protein
MFIARRREGKSGGDSEGATPPGVAPQVVPKGSSYGDDAKTPGSARGVGNAQWMGDGFDATEVSLSARQSRASLGASTSRRTSQSRKEDMVSALLEKMCIANRDETSDGLDDDEALRDQVEQELRNANPAEFLKYRNNMLDRVQTLITSEDVSKKLVGLKAINQLIDLEFGEDVDKVKKFAHFLLNVMSTSPAENLGTSSEADHTQHPVNVNATLWINPRTFELAEMSSKVLGKLILHSGALTAEVVDSQVQRAIELLNAQEENPIALSTKHYTAALTLSELARNAPTIFNVHVPVFVINRCLCERQP